MASRYLLTPIFTFLFFTMVAQTSKERLPKFQEHYVRDRETPSSIAHDFNIKTKDFLMLNNFPDDVKLKPGQKVLIRVLSDGESVTAENAYVPGASGSKTTGSKATEKNNVEKHTSTTAEKKDGTTTTRSIADASQLVGPNGAKYELSGGNFHVVQKGQTFYRIALIYGLSIDQLKKLNNMTTTDIKVGQELRISY